jgi:hypothetical protein
VWLNQLGFLAEPTHPVKECNSRLLDFECKLVLSNNPLSRHRDGSLTNRVDRLHEREYVLCKLCIVCIF